MTGKVLNNRYELVAKAGCGGMAEVYKARCRVLKRWVAVKILRDEFVNDEEFLERFEREAYAAGSLNHPNIVSIYDVGRDGNIHYIVMEYVDGITLKDYIRQNGAIAWEEASDITISILSALHKAHRHNIVHRDIKPQNILITSDNVPKVADFGIARATSTSTITTKVDTVGSVHYSSPEQARGGYTDVQSDIYSVGVTLFEMLTGRVPFDADTPVSVALKHIEEETPTPSDFVSDIPEAMDEIVLRAMKKAKSERYDSALQMIADLDRVRMGKEMYNDSVNDPFATRVIGDLGDEALTGKNSRKKSKKSNARKSKKATKKENKSKSKENKPKSRKKGFLIAAVYILLISVILGGIWFVYDKIVKDLVGAISAPRIEPVEVIRYIGMPIDEAIDDIKEKNLPYLEPMYEYHDTVEKGIVISQKPTAGISIMPGSVAITKVELTVSNGPQKMTIPEDIKFADYLEVELYLRDDLRLKPKEVAEYSDEVAEGRVIRTKPEMGSVVNIGSEVIIYRSLGPHLMDVIVPDLTGDTMDEARHKLLTEGLSIGRIFPEEREGYKGRIVDQEPKSGTAVKELTAVNIYFGDEQDPLGGDGSGTGTNTPDNTRVTRFINLPAQGNFGNKIEVVAYYTSGDTDEEIFLTRIELEKSKFPHAVTVPVSPGVKTTLIVYMDGEFQYNEEIFFE
ncbi:MAG TPA: Stk1 family PASTA domain-containing Ser/Thr kinase [Thermoclostridium sp.]|nr:Stk1 family PASTA domain-containing Ser/Thr kinase [Thermoclostridium sp.]